MNPWHDKETTPLGNHDKERSARRLRAKVDPSLVMAEVRLREVVNGSPGSIVQVLHADLRELLVAYAKLADKGEA